MSTDRSGTFSSFHKNPVLVVENFWSAEERQFFREGMGRQSGGVYLTAEGQGRFSEFGKLGQSGDRPGSRAAIAFASAVAVHSIIHGVLSEYHRQARGFQLLFIRGWRLPADP